MQSQHLENTSGFPDATPIPIKKKDLVSRHMINDLLLPLTLTLQVFDPQSMFLVSINYYWNAGKGTGNWV